MTSIDQITHEQQVSLAKETTFRVGGEASDFYIPSSEEELCLLSRYFKEAGQDFLVLGNGSNVLFADTPYKTPIIKIGDAYSSITVDGNRIHVEAGAMLSKVAAVARDHALSGLCFAAGIPGTIGGAICMNAGAYGGEMKDVVESVTIITKGGKTEVRSCDEMEFGYRRSSMQPGQIVSRVTLRLAEGDVTEINQKMEELKKARVEKQPLEYPSAGSTFKRPEGYFAGKLIDDSGLRGYRVGGAMVSEKHCGFVINYDHATAQDILTLIEDVRRIVHEKQGIWLTPEVKIFA